MKKIVLCAVILALAGSVAAQDVFPTTYGFAGVRYDYPGRHLVGSYGVVQYVTGSVWNISHADWGVSGAFSSDFALIKEVPDTRLCLGLLAGPGVDWVNIEPATTTYLTGAVGAIGIYKFTPRFNVWGTARYKLSIDSNDQFQDGMEVGLGAAVGI